MSKLIDTEKVKAEIEKLQKEYSIGNSAEAKYRCEAYNELFEILDTLPEEKKDDLEKAAENYAFTMSGEDEVLKYEAFKAGAQWQKQQQEDYPKIKGWLARDSDGLHLFDEEKPTKRENYYWASKGQYEVIENLWGNLFSEIKREDEEPTEVELIIKKNR